MTKKERVKGSESMGGCICIFREHGCSPFFITSQGAFPRGHCTTVGCLRDKMTFQQGLERTLDQANRGSREDERW